MIKSALTTTIAVIALAGPANLVEAETTNITVRVLAHDAKLIGDLAGGATVTIFHADSGQTLARGTAWGKTGNTEKIISDPRERGLPVFDTPGAAQFTAAVDLTEPTWLRVEAHAPNGFGQPPARASRTLLVLPGHDIDGEGLVLELHGLIVRILTPSMESSLVPGGTLAVETGVKLLCTCPITAGGLWDAAQYEVTAQLLRRGVEVATATLDFTGTTNVFAGHLELPTVEAGQTDVLQLRVTAANDERQNFGVDSLVFRIRGPQ